MKRPLVLLLIPLLTITGLYIAPGIISPAHAGGLVGKVCIAQNTATVCPQTAPTITGPGPGISSHFLVNVILNNSDALSSFDITLLADHTVLGPADVKFGTINLGSSVTEIIKCIGGVNKIGTSPCPSTDNANTIHYAVSGTITASPITGVLLTANYTVITNSANTPITFQTGCTSAPTSVAGGVCVTISPGTTTPDPETSQTAKFSNLPYFDLIPSSGTLQVSKGDIDLSGSLTITQLNTFSGTVNLSGSSSPSGPIFTVSPNSVTIAPGSDGLAGLNVTVPKTVIPGNYTLTITGTSGTLPPNSVTILLIVPKPDFTITPNPSHLLFNVTVSSTATIALSSVGNFNGTVTLSAQSSNPLALNATLQKKSLFISMKGTNTTMLTVKPTIAGEYSVNVTVTSGLLSHTSTVAVTVVDFFMTVPNSILTVVNGTSKSEPITVPVNDLYNVTVTITSIYVDLIGTTVITGPSPGLAVTCNPTTLIIISTNGTGGIVKGSVDTSCNVKANAIGSYIVTVVAISGNGNRTSTHAVTFPVTVIAPSFYFVLSATVTTVPVSSSTTLTVKIAGTLGLKDNVTIGLVITGGNLSPPPTLSQNITIAYVTSTSPNATVLVTVTTASATPPGFYTLTVTGSGIHSKTIVIARILVIVVAIASPHDLAVNFVSPSTTSATVGDDVTISIEVQNLGKLTENATIVAIVGDQSIGNKNVTSLAPGQNVNVTITWHTTGFSPGAYMIGGKVLQVTGETNLSNNLLRYATPVTLNGANTSVFQSSYVLPLAVIAAVIVIAATLAIYFLPKRKPRVA